MGTNYTHRYLDTQVIVKIIFRSSFQLKLPVNYTKTVNIDVDIRRKFNHMSVTANSSEAYHSLQTKFYNIIYILYT